MLLHSAQPGAAALMGTTGADLAKKLVRASSAKREADRFENLDDLQFAEPTRAVIDCKVHF